MAVWLYFRFPLSLRMVEEMLAARGIDVSHETVRRWAEKFGRDYANRLRRRAIRPGDTWHLDEVVITIAGEKHWLWRAVDGHGFVLDVLVQKRRDTKAAKRLMRKLLKKDAMAPRVMITDKLRSYAAAKRDLRCGAEHRQHKGLNNRAENSHQPTRRRERIMKRFKQRGMFRAPHRRSDRPAWKIQQDPFQGRCGQLLQRWAACAGKTADGELLRNGSSSPAKVWHRTLPWSMCIAPSTSLARRNNSTKSRVLRWESRWIRCGCPRQPIRLCPQRIREPISRSGRDPGHRPYAHTGPNPRKQGRKTHPHPPCRVWRLTITGCGIAGGAHIRGFWCALFPGGIRHAGGCHGRWARAAWLMLKGPPDCGNRPLRRVDDGPELTCAADRALPGTA